MLSGAPGVEKQKLTSLVDTAAYSIYALVEWSLIILDVAFDSIAILDFPDVEAGDAAANRALQVSISYAETDLYSSPNGDSSIFLAQLDQELPHAPGCLAQMLAKIELATAGTRHFAADIYLGTGAARMTLYTSARADVLCFPIPNVNITHTLSGFLFWTGVTALGPMIFYSAVWAMGLSGDEILLFCCISPFLLVLPPLRSLFARPGIGNLGLLVSVASVYAGDTDGESGASEGEGAARLRWTALGLACATMGHVAAWWQVRTDDRKLENRTT